MNNNMFMQAFEPCETVAPCNFESPFVKYQVTPIEGGGNHMTVVLLDFITVPASYVPIIHFLRTATSDDKVTFLINNPGGILQSGLVVGDAMRATKAHVETIAISIAASAAAEIFTCGHKLTVKPISCVMYHTASYLAMGKTTAHRRDLEYTEDLIGAIMQSTINKNLLTEEEYRMIIAEGRDIFLSAEEIATRLSETIPTSTQNPYDVGTPEAGGV